MQISKRGFRADIQALRGFAVMIVVLYHSGLGVFAGGYLGVDIFFVVSGFLITSIIYRQTADRTFSFAAFYTRRVRRLLPAAYVTLAATGVASLFLLSAGQFRDFAAQMIGAVLFATNYVLWSQTGYFSPDAAFRPLLHMWSLAIEEQYYLIVPLIFVLLPRRLIGTAVAATTIVSLATCLYLARHSPSVAFFWLPTRAWELGIGSLAALIADGPRFVRVARLLVVPALLLLLAVPLFPLSMPDPGGNALLVCAATAIMIVANTAVTDRLWPVRLLARIGDFSYSLYLVHWPLFALTRILFVAHDLPTWLEFALIGLAIMLAFATYRWIEEPVRRSALYGRRLVFAVIGSSTALIAFALGAAAIRAGSGHDAVLAPVAGLDRPACFADVDWFDGRCARGGSPQMLIWGDSLSAHIVPGVAATTGRPFAQASKGFCSPFADYAVVNHPNERALANSCLRFNASVLDYLRAHPTIAVVALTGFYQRGLVPEVVAIGAGGIRPASAVETAVAQRETVAAIRALGRRAVIITPPPVSGYDLGQCWERRAEHLAIIGDHRDCSIDRGRTAGDQVTLDGLMARFVADGAPVIRLDEALCRQGQCETIANGLPIFRDGDHLSRYGAELVGRRLRLGERIWTEAR